MIVHIFSTECLAFFTSEKELTGERDVHIMKLRKRVRRGEAAELVTIKDISKACGVSASTVSKVLNGYTDISKETVENVFRTAEAMGYTPNAAARMLKTNRSHSLGVLFVDEMQSGLRHEYFSAMLSSLKDEAERLGYDITFISRNLGGRSMSYLEHCRYRKCDGVVIACVDFSDPAVTDLLRSEIPVVTVDYTFDQRGAVVSDNVRGMSELVEYIISQGHHDLAYIYGEMTSVTRNRLTGFYRTCESHGIQIPDDYVRAARFHDPDSSARETRALLELKHPPTCILYPDDICVLGGLSELERRGLSVPEDVSVAGYDGALLSKALRPPLTTIRQDTDTLGKRAADFIIDAIEHKKTYLPRQELIPGRLIPGGSVRRR